MSSFYDNSPGLIDDMAPTPKGDAPVALLNDDKQPPTSAAKPEAAKPDAAASEVRPAVAPKPEQASEIQSPFADGLERSPFAADVSPYGSNVPIDVQRAAEAKGKTADEAKAIGAEWVASFAHFGVGQVHISHLIDAGLQVSDKTPDEATLKSWRTEAQARLASNYGGPEGAAKALKTAQAWVKLHPKLGAFLERTKLGDNPRVIDAIAATAHQARKDGRFK
jgi:hypothetical protein